MSSLYSVFNVLVGGDKRNRTAGLLLARQALSQLSYTPKQAYCLALGTLKTIQVEARQLNLSVADAYQ